jgi:predicted transcriptional regulator
MSVIEPVQNFANHKRNPPLYFIVALLVLAAEVVHHIIRLFQQPSLGTAWSVVVWLAVLAIAYAARRMPQVVQDRTIRDEMRQRLARLLPVERHGEISRLALSQLVALRFASDAELPALVAEVSSGRLVAATAIKQKITAWQADWLRV